MNPGLIFIRQLILPPFRLVPSSEKDGLPFRMDAPEQIMEEVPRGCFLSDELGRWTGLLTDTPFYRVFVRPSVLILPSG